MKRRLTGISTASVIVMMALWGASAAQAHETLFGNSPRTIWKGGAEVEVEVEYEAHRRFFEGDKPASNPTDLRMERTTYAFAYTYGITRDWAVKIETPFAREVHKEKGMLSESFFGLADMMIATKYRVYNDVSPGGSTQVASFFSVSLPTGRERRGLSLSDDAYGFTGGVSGALSTTRQYLWSDISASAFTRRKGDGEGPIARAHVAYARRLRELINFDETDYLLLLELDAAKQGRGKVGGVKDPDSGVFAIHAGIGFQVNITNIYEIKFGYNLPVYRKFEGRQFADEGMFVLMFNYLI